MAKAPSISNAAAIAACNSIVDKIDAGSAAGYMNVYAGSKPSNVDTALTGQTLLATFEFNASAAFGNATDVAPGARATLADVPITTTAVGTGTAAFFRVFDSDDVAIIDGTVGTTDSDAIIDNTSVVTGQDVTLESYTFTVPEAAGQP